MLPDPVFTNHWSATLQNFELSAGKSLAELLKELDAAKPLLTAAEHDHARDALLSRVSGGMGAPETSPKDEEKDGGSPVTLVSPSMSGIVGSNRRIDPTRRRHLKRDNTPNDSDRVEIGPTGLAFA